MSFTRQPAAVLARLLAVCVLVLLGGAGAVTSAAADQGKGSPGYCQDGAGVTVIVDFGDLGGEPVVRCAPGDQPNGVTALQNAGFTVTGSQRFGLAVACRIDGKPGPDAESCAAMPSATDFWGYWNGANGAWVSSQEGAMTHKPALGGFEGWSFWRGKSFGTNPPPRVAPVRPAQQPATTSSAGVPAESGGFPWGVVIGVAALVVIGGAAGIVAARRKRGAR
ncbi:hypothetical protein ACFWY9_03485 [Amycolatopsis sp. NPDC059027]|uniref:hypothetical protein n=1 Tax=Amycolatopsis sp. NPDC059027 TaxID=3346709 RepID=UPI00366C134E